MLSKKNKINRKLMDVLYISKDIKSVYNQNIILRFFIDKNNQNKRIAFIVPKTVVKKANQRNLLKRRANYVIKSFLNQIPQGFVGAFVFNKKNIINFLGKKNNKFNPINNLRLEIKDILDKYAKKEKSFY